MASSILSYLQLAEGSVGLINGILSGKRLMYSFSLKIAVLQIDITLMASLFCSLTMVIEAVEIFPQANSADLWEITSPTVLFSNSK